MNQALVKVRSVSNDRIQVARIVVVVTTASTVHCAKTCHWQAHVLVVLPPEEPPLVTVVGVVGSSGAVAVAVAIGIWIVVRAVEPDTRENDGCCTQSYCNWSETAR